MKKYEPEVFKVRSYKYEYIPRINLLDTYLKYIKELELRVIFRFMDLCIFKYNRTFLT